MNVLLDLFHQLDTAQLLESSIHSVVGHQQRQVSVVDQSQFLLNSISLISVTPPVNGCFGIKSNVTLDANFEQLG